MKLIPVSFKSEELDGYSKEIIFNSVIDETLGSEEYNLTVNNGRAEAVCGSKRAEYYAKCTLSQLRSPDGSYKNCRIVDKPRFDYRSFMIDSARHYQEVSEIKRFIKIMSELKMNVFHWHLSEDQGWRIEIEKYPELKKAAVRKFSNFGKTREDKPYGIYYTKEQIKEVVEYAAEHFVDVVPEIDIPGHTSALLSVFPELTCSGKAVEVKTHQGIFEDVICPAKEKSVQVLKDIFNELCELFPFNIYHLGGDEVKDKHWSECPDCKRKMEELKITSFHDYENYFLTVISDYLAEKGKRCIVWNDAAKGKGLNKKNVIVQYWKENDPNTVEYANGGGNIILSPFTYYYLDYDYDITSLRRVVNFKPVLKGMTSEGRASILGVEAPIWTEYINNRERMEELAFPRIIAVACTAWQSEGLSYKQFLAQSENVIKRLKEEGVSFRDEKHWGYTRAKTPGGWLRFVKTNYSINYILGKD